MNNTVLQIPMTMELREKSEKAAVEAGFSSLQEAVRIFLKKFSHKELVVSFDMPKIKLSAKNEKRYIEMIKDYKKNKSEYRSFNDVDDIMKYLNS